jgi:hypothetical protein
MCGYPLLLYISNIPFISVTVKWVNGFCLLSLSF